ncbi:hypothetical protein AVEN_251059-1 [Araneus ventricosus]|uniref:Uncharacterized protein n=1 Tax=Araneus ventricosus TaxID=182803 RepID=A0A4Y2DLT4_ARAVE|nr:hypothetical protein AVEN_251059-1 [Araneus ventricosus]
MQVGEGGGGRSFVSSLFRAMRLTPFPPPPAAMGQTNSFGTPTGKTELVKHPILRLHDSYFVMDLVSLNSGQIMRMAPESSSLSKCPQQPNGRMADFDEFNINEAVGSAGSGLESTPLWS